MNGHLIGLRVVIASLALAGAALAQSANALDASEKGAAPAVVGSDTAETASPSSAEAAGETEGQPATAESIQYLKLLALDALLQQDGDPAASEYLGRLAELGDAWGTFRLGWLYYVGENGVAEDKFKAAEYFQRAADLGHGEALTWLGRMIEQGQGGLQEDEEKAAGLYRRAMATGDGGPADLFLGYVLLRGSPVEVEEGISLLTANDSVYAHSSLAAHFKPDENGRGGNMEKYVHHVRVGATKGDHQLMFRLAFILEGASPYEEYEDPDEAAGWLLTSIENGNEDVVPLMRRNIEHWSLAFRKALQRHLKKAGHYDGKIDGKFGPESMAALEEFAFDAW